MGIRVKHSSAAAVPLDLAFQTGANQAQERGFDRALQLQQMMSRQNGGRSSRGFRQPPVGFGHVPKQRERRQVDGSMAEAARIHRATVEKQIEAAAVERMARERAIAEVEQKKEHEAKLGQWTQRPEQERQQLRKLQAEKQSQMEALTQSVRRGELKMGGDQFNKALRMIEDKYQDLDMTFIPSEQDEIRYSEKRKPYKITDGDQEFGFDTPKDYFDAKKVKQAEIKMQHQREYNEKRMHLDAVSKWRKDKQDWIKENAEAIKTDIDEAIQTRKANGDTFSEFKVRHELTKQAYQGYDQIFPAPEEPAFGEDRQAAPAAQQTPGQPEAPALEQPKPSIVPDAAPPMEAAEKRNFDELNKYAGTFRQGDVAQRRAILEELMAAKRATKDPKASVLLRQLMNNLITFAEESDQVAMQKGTGTP